MINIRSAQTTDVDTHMMEIHELESQMLQFHLISKFMGTFSMRSKQLHIFLEFTSRKKSMRSQNILLVINNRKSFFASYESNHDIELSYFFFVLCITI